MDKELAALKIADKFADKALELQTKLNTSLEILREALYILNQVPNNKYRTFNNDMNTYNLCSKIDKFLKED